jgi:peptidoglycan DL-endopeptidase CwlO
VKLCALREPGELPTRTRQLTSQASERHTTTLSIRHARTTLLTRTAFGAALAGGLVAGAALPASADMPAGVPAASAAPSSHAASNAAAPFVAPSGAIRAVPASYSTAATPSGSDVLQVAARYLGTPYLYGGTTPAGFDCSGYTSYVFRQVGVFLPRTADQQMQATRHVPAGAARAGDLVFYVSGNHAYHAAIYAGDGYIYDAPHSGTTVSRRPMWAGTVVYSRALN